MAGTNRAHKSHSLSLIFFAILLFAGVGRSQQQDLAGNLDLTFQQVSAEAASAREAGKVDDAIRLYQHALKLQPDWAEGWWYLGTLNYDADHYAEAIPALQSLVKISPTMGPAVAFLGLSEFEIKDYAKSLEHLQKAHELGYEDDVALEKVAVYHLGLLYNRSGQFEQTVQLLTSGGRPGRPPDEIKVALGMALLRIPLLPSEVDPGKDALIHAAGEAAVLLDGGSFDRAAIALQQLAAEYPKTPYLRYAVASALTGAGKPEVALQELTLEAQLVSHSALPYTGIASLELELRHTKEALSAAHKAVLLEPESVAAHEVLAKTLNEAGERKEFTDETAIIKTLESSLPAVDTSQREIYSRGRNEDIIPHQTTNSSGDLANSFEMLGEKAATAQAAGQMDSAISYYRRAVTLRPEWEEGWRNVGTLYYATAQFADAVVALKNATAINPRNGNAWALLGLSEFQTKDYKNSLIHLERGRSLGFAGNASAVQIARYHLAILLNREGQFDQATELLASETGSGPLANQVILALGMALLRIQQLPDELNPAKDAVVQLAGETAALLSESKYDQAFLKFDQMLKIDSNLPYIHYAYGSALASASRYEEAEAQLVEETKISPASALSYLRRSTIALQLRHAESAAQLAQHGLQLAPESGEGHYLLGRSWLELGKITESVKELEGARGMAPNSPEVRFSLARAYAKAGQMEAAEQERATFERLNALVEMQRSRSGNQAYGAIQTQNGIRAARVSEQPQPESQPK